MLTVGVDQGEVEARLGADGLSCPCCGGRLARWGFARPADAIQWGETDVLRGLLDADPALVSARSPFPHEAMLLHHVAANGIEVERQLQSPPNAPEIMRLLLERGAEPDAVCRTYGGGANQTTLYLLVSSVHPATAGVQAQLVDELCRGGAAVNGPDDDGTPLWTAISFGYSDAAEALVRAGARVDNLVLDAALGHLDAVRGSVGPDGALRPGAARALRAGADGPELPAAHTLEFALIQAAGHGRRTVVEFLLDLRPDLTVTEPFFGATARGAARHQGHAEIAALIDARMSR